MNSKKGNILLIVISGIALVAIITAGYLYWQNQKFTQGQPIEKGNPNYTKQIPDAKPKDASREPTGSAEMANWKTYINRIYNFSVKYPKGWNIDHYPSRLYTLFFGPKRTIFYC